MWFRHELNVTLTVHSISPVKSPGAVLLWSVSPAGASHKDETAVLRHGLLAVRKYAVSWFHCLEESEISS